ncbi:MAG TPA: DMT family transporter [Brevibacterium senegalense]|uniref:DMT family transporter n=1 Tax=Brevibacterium senegalense TaxID=1033736 RepID=A0A921SMM6_9MICO|nr:DMT family transporter [Brevibacterium senegalense]
MRVNGTLLLAGAATVLAGFLMAFQSRANGSLAGVIGSSVFAATVSFLGGLLILLLILAISRPGRRGVGRLRAALGDGTVRWWMLLGGLGGSTVVLAQALTVPLIGVSVLTMSFVCGQLLGAIVVDGTDLPPSGRTALSARRLVGTAVVLVGVVLVSVGGFSRGIPLWAPLVPLLAGAMTSVQSALNGRVRAASASSLTATTVNFLVGSVFLLGCSGLAWLLGARVTGLPEFPGQSWLLMGGALGIVFIGVTSATVSHLGVLLVSMTSLFGNLLSSVLVDLLHPGAVITPLTVLAMVCVLSGVVIASWPRRGGGPPRRARITPPA